MDDAVFEAQSYLRNIGKLDSDISRVVPDGIFAAETTDAVKSFQRKHGLEETGIINFETWELIKSKNSEAVFTASEPIQIVRITNEDLPLKDLGQLLNPPVSKSGVNHRLRKLSQAAEELRSRNKEIE